MGQRKWTARASVALPALPHRRRSDAARSDGNSGEGQRAVIRARLPRPLARADARDGEHPLECTMPVDQRRSTTTWEKAPSASALVADRGIAEPGHDLTLAP